MAWSKIAQEAYNGLFPNSSTYKKCRTFDHFSSSSFYVPLISFGKFVVNSDIVSYRKYIKYLQINNVNIKDWTDEKIYGMYLKNLFSKEDPEDAVIRTLEFIEKWSRENNKNWEDFFSEIHPIEAIRHIKTGRLSPWIILQDGIADKLFERVLDEQLIEIADIIDPTYWGIRFKKQNHKIQDTINILRGFNE